MNDFTFYAKWYKENFKYEDVPEALVGYLPVFKRERVKTVCVGHVDEIRRAFFYAELGGRSLPYVDFVCLSVIINAIRRMWKEWAEFYLES